MTMKEAIEGGVDDGTETIETIPEEAHTVEAEEPRHLAMGSSLVTLCGLERAGLRTAHPSKAKRDDCPACRDVYRNRKPNLKDRQAPAPVVGDRIALPDGSAWLVEDTREGGMDIRCLVAGSQNAKGRKTTISAGSDVRALSEIEFETIRLAAEPKKVDPPVGAEQTRVVAAAKIAGSGKWTPSKADVDAVVRMRQEGKSYIAIETAMGWPSGHGNRPFRIVKGAWQYDLLREK
jgi:hypothetical protein